MLQKKRQWVQNSTWRPVYAYALVVLQTLVLHTSMLALQYIWIFIFCRLTQCPRLSWHLYSHPSTCHKCVFGCAYTRTPKHTHTLQLPVKTKKIQDKIDWCCFYYFVRNSLVLSSRIQVQTKDFHDTVPCLWRRTTVALLFFLTVFLNSKFFFRVCTFVCSCVRAYACVCGACVGLPVCVCAVTYVWIHLWSRSLFLKRHFWTRCSLLHLHSLKQPLSCSSTF